MTGPFPLRTGILDILIRLSQINSTSYLQAVYHITL